MFFNTFSCFPIFLTFPNVIIPSGYWLPSSPSRFPRKHIMGKVRKQEKVLKNTSIWTLNGKSMKFLRKGLLFPSWCSNTCVFQYFFLFSYFSHYWFSGKSWRRWWQPIARRYNDIRKSEKIGKQEKHNRITQKIRKAYPDHWDKIRNIRNFLYLSFAEISFS